MRTTILLWLGWLMSGAAMPAPLVLAHVDRPCPCTYPGGVARQGETVCLEVGGRHQLARCEMVLNNSSWRLLGEGCEPTASASSPGHPAA